MALSQCFWIFQEKDKLFRERPFYNLRRVTPPMEREQCLLIQKINKYNREL
jgi:hypothetical protein